jgi:hypothetical protein
MFCATTNVQSNSPENARKLHRHFYEGGAREGEESRGQRMGHGAVRWPSLHAAAAQASLMSLACMTSRSSPPGRDSTALLVMLWKTLAQPSKSARISQTRLAGAATSSLPSTTKIPSSNDTNVASRCPGDANIVDWLCSSTACCCMLSTLSRVLLLSRLLLLLLVELAPLAATPAMDTSDLDLPSARTRTGETVPPAPQVSRSAAWACNGLLQHPELRGLEELGPPAALELHAECMEECMVECAV